MNEIRIFHNPRCSTSRKVLALIRDAGHEPVIVEYLKNPPAVEELLAIARASGAPLRTLVRTKQPEYEEQGLDDPQLSEAELARAMVATPVLINRPIVTSAAGARLCRPIESVLELLPAARSGDN